MQQAQHLRTKGWQCLSTQVVNMQYTYTQTVMEYHSCM